MNAVKTVTIDRRYCGPPGSGNGGYVCGITALALTDGAAEVRLRRPPPLDRPLRVERSDGAVALYDGDDLVSDGRPVALDLNVPDPVPFEEAVKAADAFDLDAYRTGHAFPRCFTCGPDRDADDGLRLFPASAGRGDGVNVWPWVPGASLIDASGAVDAAVVWAALDCPSGFAWFGLPELTGPVVLAGMTAVVYQRPSPGDRLVAGGWPIAAEGRKLHAGSVIWSDDGEVVAANSATWILLNKEQQAAFGAAVS